MHEESLPQLSSLFRDISTNDSAVLPGSGILLHGRIS